MLTVVDQAYFEYIDRDDYPDAVERYFKAGRDVVVLRTFSKIYGLAGQRVGYAVGPEQVIAAMTKVRRPFDLTTTGAGRRARLDRRRRRDRAAPRDQRRRASNGSPRSSPSTASSPVPSVGNFVYVDVGSDAADLFERLLHEGVIVRPLAGFGSPTAIRVSVGTPDEIDEFAGALGRALEPYVRSRGARCRLCRRRSGKLRDRSARIRSRAAVFGNGMFRLLFTATLGSAIGTYATTIALTSDIDARTHSTWWVALLFLVTFMPRIFVGLFIGPLIDRLSRKTLIVGSDLVRLVVFALLPFAAPSRHDDRARGGVRDRRLVLPPRGLRRCAEPRR